MAIAERGYRRWEGRLRGRALRWWIIARWGVRLSGQSKWLRRLVLAAWLPLLYWVLAFFAIGQVTDPETIGAVEDTWQFALLKAQFGGALADAFVRDPASFRPTIWATLFYFYLYTTQVWVMLVTAVVGPRLISADLSAHALGLYFARPITRLDYVAGKLGVVAFWIGAVTLGPVTALYGLSILFSPSLEALSQTIFVWPRAAGACAVVMLGAGAPVLALSSLTRNPRFLGFAWAGLWVLSHVASTVLSLAIFRIGGAEGRDWTGLVSFFRNLLAVAFRFLEVETKLAPAARLSHRASRWMERYSYEHDWRWSLCLLLVGAALSLWVVARRVGRAAEEGAQ